MFKKSSLAIVTSGIVIIAIGFFVSSCSSLRSESSIRASLLKETPLGSSSSDVRAFVANQGWLDRSYAGTNFGFYKQESGEPAHEVGVSSICGQLGHYWLPFRTDVTAFWGFDTNGHLIDVWVWKTTDAP
jgi:hypothetical protein